MEVPECPGCRERDARIAALEAEVARLAPLEGRVAELETLIKELSKPPVPPRGQPALPPGPGKRPTGRKAGGQPGHPPHLKQLVGPERVNETVKLVPSHCKHCQATLPQEPSPDDPPPLRHQVAELPKVVAHITEYQGHARTCPCCGKVTRASIPADIRAHSVGPHLTATAAYLVGHEGVSKRAVEGMFENIFQVQVSLGTIANLEEETSAALAPAHGQALRAVQQAAVKNVDETGWKQAGQKRWLWVAASSTAVVFLIHRLRNLKALRTLLGDTWQGIIGSDRWRAYDEIPVLSRQICWAHLKRNWEKMAERGGKAKSVANCCLSVHQRVFELWHLFRGGGLTRLQMDHQMAPLMLELADALRLGARCRDPKTKRFCARLASVFPALWTFVVEEGVEPTNNHVERVQRRAVLWRRRSFGCHSAAGCRFVERILTVVQTLRLQGRSVVQFLHDSIHAHRAGHQGPNLVIER